MAKIYQVIFALLLISHAIEIHKMVSEQLEDEDEDNYDTYGSNTDGPHTLAEKNVDKQFELQTEDTNVN